MPQAVLPVAAAAAGSWLSGRSNRAERDLTDAQTTNYQAQTGLAGLMRQLAESQASLAGPAYGKSLNYYQSLLSGNRTAATNAMLPERRQISDLYGGAERSIRNTSTGASRDRQLGDLSRERAGRLADLVPQARAGAASTLLDAANPARTIDSLGGASSGYASAFQSGQQLFDTYETRRRRSMDAGRGWAQLFSQFGGEDQNGDVLGWLQKLFAGQGGAGNMAGGNAARIVKGLRF